MSSQGPLREGDPGSESGHVSVEAQRLWRGPRRGLGRLEEQILPRGAPGGSPPADILTVARGSDVELHPSEL